MLMLVKQNHRAVGFVDGTSVTDCRHGARLWFGRSATFHHVELPLNGEGLIGLVTEKRREEIRASNIRRFGEDHIDWYQNDAHEDSHEDQQKGTHMK